MGSDLYMEERNWRPRENKIYWEWDGEDYNLVIEVNHFYKGYQKVYNGPVEYGDINNPLVDALIQSMGLKIPLKPTPPVSMRNEIDEAIVGFIGWRESGLVDKIVSILNSYGVNASQTRVKETDE